MYINWNLPIILCEGAFDAMAIKRNAIPLFGKKISTTLMKKIIESNVEKIYLEKGLEKISKVKDKLKKYRGCGLERDGEYSYENLVFKFLRRNGYIQKLFDFQNNLIDNRLSLAEQK